MKKTHRHQVKFQPFARRQVAGTTLLEMMFAITIMLWVIVALTAVQLMGMRQDQVVMSKCGASDSSRQVLNQLPTDIRSAKMWFVGNMSGTAGFTNFTAITNSSQGNALELFQTTNGSQFILYYFDLSNTNNNDAHLVRTTSSSWAPVVLASNLVNWLGNGYSFTVENYAGKLATNLDNSNTYKDIIHVELQFCQFEFPMTQVGTNGLYDFYKIEFRATPHLPE